jgi:hypothetical protein
VPFFRVSNITSTRGEADSEPSALWSRKYYNIVLYKSSVIPPPPGLAYVCKWLDTDRVAHQCLPALESCGLHSDRTRLREGCENRQKRGIYRTGADCLDHGGAGDEEDGRIAEDGQAQNERTPEAFVTALRGEVRPDPGLHMTWLPHLIYDLLLQVTVAGFLDPMSVRIISCLFFLFTVTILL